MPLHCVSDPTLDRPSEPTNPVSPTHFPRNELFSGKHFARDFRIMLRREIVRKTNPRWETAPGTKGPGRQAEIFMWTNYSGRQFLGTHIKTWTIWIFTRVSLYLFPVHNCSFGLSFYLTRPATSQHCHWLGFITCLTRCIEQYFFIHGAKLRINVKTINFIPWIHTTSALFVARVWRSDALIRRDMSLCHEVCLWPKFRDDWVESVNLCRTRARDKVNTRRPIIHWNWDHTNHRHKTPESSSLTSQTRKCHEQFTYFYKLNLLAWLI